MKRPRPSVNQLQRLLSVSKALSQRSRPRTKPDEVAAAIAGWVREIDDSAQRLERDLAEILEKRVDAAEFGRSLHFAALRTSVRATPPHVESNENASFLLDALRTVAIRQTPTVWLLGECDRGGLVLQEQVDESPVDSGAERLTTSWRLAGTAVGQSLEYAEATETQFRVCFYWQGDERVEVRSGGDPWDGEAWVDEDGKVVGKKFCRTFEFFNISAKDIELTVSTDECGRGELTLTVENPNSDQSNDAPPILDLRPVQHPPQGPDPILIPNDFTNLPPLDPFRYERVVEAFTRFRSVFDRPLPYSVQAALDLDRLRRDSHAFDGLLGKVIAELEG